MTEYFAELAARFPAGFEPGDALDEAVTSLNPPRGVFVLALVEDEPAGCGGAQFLDGETAEVKRMWVSPVHRGVGLGRRLLAHLEGEARRAGRRRIVLDTNASLTEAINLYRSCGYAPTDRYNANPYADRWFVKELPGGGSPALPTPASGEGPLPSAPFE
jgi:GNAT superfamily N-acetyltransferase